MCWYFDRFSSFDCAKGRFRIATLLFLLLTFGGGWVAPPKAAADERTPFLFVDSLCPDLDVLLCEGFESRTAGTLPNPDIWSLELGEGSEIVVDDAIAARGSHAARFRVTQDRKWAYLQTETILKGAERRIWGRLFLMIGDARPATEALVHWNFVEIMAGTDPIKMYRYGGISLAELGRNYFIWNHEMRPRPAGFDELAKSDAHDATVPPGQWLCIEWMFDANEDESRLFRDGEERAALHVKGEVNGTTFDIPPFRALNVGWTVYQPLEKEYVVWIDEIALDKDRIGCDR